MTPAHEPRGDRHYEGFQQPQKIEEGGVLRIAGAFLLDHEDEIVNLLKNEAQLAETKNPAHKINKIVKADGKLVVEVSEHNLAFHLGKALVHAYKGEHIYKFLKGEKFIEVDWRRD